MMQKKNINDRTTINLYMTAELGCDNLSSLTESI